MKPAGQRRATGPVRPSASARLLINVTLGGLWLSGGAWLICRYFLRIEGEWGLEPNPAEPWWMRLHGMCALLAIWTFGMLWGRHIVGAWATGRRRLTGSLLFAWLILMMITAYLLVWGTEDGPFVVVSPVHWVSGLALPLGYLAHRFLKPRAMPSTPAS